LSDLPRYPVDTIMPDGMLQRIGARLTEKRILRLLAVLVVFTGCATANTVTFTTTLVTPGAPGVAVWENDYTLSGFSFVQYEDFQLLFDPAVFQTLLNGAATPSSDWDLLLVQPDPGLPAAGVYDMMALANGPSFAGPFSVQYMLLGSTPPASQVYQVLQLDSNGNVVGDSLEIGTALAPSGAVPEPSSLQLYAIAGLGVVVLRAARCRRRA
jgi:hypothetical protein